MVAEGWQRLCDNKSTSGKCILRCLSSLSPSCKIKNWGWIRWPGLDEWRLGRFALLVDEVWRGEREVDAHNAQARELIVLCRILCCVWDSALTKARPLFPWAVRGREREAFSTFPPSPEWPFGNLAESQNSKLEAKGCQNILYVLPSSPPSAGSASFSVSERIKKEGAHEVRL